MQEDDASPPHPPDGAEGTNNTDDGGTRGVDVGVLEAAQSGSVTADTRRPSYSWPLRLFLIAFVFDMVTRSLITLTPYDDSWRKEMGMERFPLPLPTPRELRKIENGKDRKYETVSQRYGETATSLVSYANPWPDADVREHIDGISGVGKFVLVWLGTRLSFVGALTGVDQNWPMFAPNVRTSRLIPRAKLIFEDGSSKQLWLLGEPWDLTSYSRWFIKRPLQIDIRLHQDYDARLGVSQHLARLHSVSDSGSPLRYVEFHNVYYRLPKPGEDAYEVLQRQTRKPLEDDPFWRYDVESERGKTLQDKHDKKKKERERKREKERKERARKRAVPSEKQP